MTQTDTKAVDSIEAKANPNSKPEEGCPECGGEVYREPMCVAGGPNETTEGWACLDCTWYEVDTPAHHRSDKLETIEGRINLGPHGTGHVEDDAFDPDREVYILEGECDCGDDLILPVKKDSRYAAEAEWTAIGEHCPACRFG